MNLHLSQHRLGLGLGVNDACRVFHFLLDLGRLLCGVLERGFGEILLGLVHLSRHHVRLGRLVKGLLRLRLDADLLLPGCGLRRLGLLRD